MKFIFKGEIDKNIEPKYIFSIHSFTKLYENQKREEEIGILTSDSDKFDKFGDYVILPKK